MPPRSDRKPEGIQAREELFSPFGSLPRRSMNEVRALPSRCVFLRSRIEL
jgi:hypothetical protein